MTTKGRIRPSKPMSVLALVVGIAGVVAVTPKFGMFGMIWTLAALAICVYYAANIFAKRGVAEDVVEFDTPSPHRPEEPPAMPAEERLHKLEDL